MCPFVSDPPVDAAVVDVPEEPAVVVAAAELSGATLLARNVSVRHSVYGCGGRGSTAVVSSGETFTVPVFLRITAASLCRSSRDLLSFSTTVLFFETIFIGNPAGCRSSLPSVSPRCPDPASGLPHRSAPAAEVHPSLRLQTPGDSIFQNRYSVEGDCHLPVAVVRADTDGRL